MKFRPLGATGLQVSELCLGTWSLSGQWGEDIEPGVAAIRRAFELGVNFFDTAYAYGHGAAEAALARGLGDLIKTHRDELVIATKGGIHVPQSIEEVQDIADIEETRESSPEFLRETLEHSLRVLGTDYVDVYFIHWPDRSRPFAEVARTMHEFVSEGLVRHVGLSNFTVAEMKAFREGGPFGVAQVPYSLLRREIEAEVLPFCEREDIGVMGWSALASGLLTGALGPGYVFPPGDWRGSAALEGKQFEALNRTLEVFQGRNERFNAVIERLKEAARERGVSLAQLSLAWLLARPFGVVPIIGAQEPAHVESSAAALDLSLDADEARRLADIAAESPSIAMDDYDPDR